MTRPTCLVLALLLVAPARIARTDDGVCGAQVCPAGSPRAYEEISCSAPACTCWNNCDGSSSSGGGDKGKGAALFIAFVVTFPFIPLMNIEFMSSKGEKLAFGSREEAKARWKKHRAEVIDYEQHGKLVEKEMKSLASWLDAEAKLGMRDAVVSAPKKKQHQPVRQSPLPQPEPNARERCQGEYEVELNKTNRILAHAVLCECLRVADYDTCRGDRPCEVKALEEFKRCRSADPTTP